MDVPININEDRCRYWYGSSYICIYIYIYTCRICIYADPQRDCAEISQNIESATDENIDVHVDVNVSV